jgi:hypothetical protein
LESFGKFGLFPLFPNSMQSSETFFFHTSRKFSPSNVQRNSKKFLSSISFSAINYELLQVDQFIRQALLSKDYFIFMASSVIPK